MSHRGHVGGRRGIVKLWRLQLICHKGRSEKSARVPMRPESREIGESWLDKYVKDSKTRENLTGVCG